MLVPHPLPILVTSQPEHHIIQEQFDAEKVFGVFIIGVFIIIGVFLGLWGFYYLFDQKYMLNYWNYNSQNQNK